MAQRRMVSVKIIDSAKFIKMPVSTQALYFHLIARADDDGIVEAFNVMRMTGASEDDLKVLCAKEFVKVLNEDMVAFITDWHEHNLIRADRKIDSMYQHLLLQVVPQVELKEKKERADRRKLLTDGNRTSQGQPEDGIGKVSLGQCSLGKEKETNARFDEFWKAYPRKDNKKKAVVAFNSIPAKDIDTVIADVIARSKTEQWTKENGKYVPMATTYIHGKRWEDEISQIKPQQKHPHAVQPADPIRIERSKAWD